MIRMRSGTIPWRSAASYTASTIPPSRFNVTTKLPCKKVAAGLFVFAVGAVSGTGVVGGNLTATSVTHNWGSISVGASGGNYGVEITNSTSSAVTLSFSGLTGGSSGFSLVGSSCGASLAVNANCELVFSFTPTATGFVSGTYPITSSSPLYFNGSAVSPSQITLEGTGR